MKKKRLNRDLKWGFQYFPYHQMRVETEFFKGFVSLIQLTDGETLYWSFEKAGKAAVAGAGMTWLQFVPDGSNHLVTAKYLPNGRVSVWYVDVIEKIEYAEDGVAVFTDKYLDVYFTPQGDVVVDDKDELDAAYASGELSKEQYEEALAEGDKILSEYCADVEAMEVYCNRILNYVKQFLDIPECAEWTSVEQVNKGFSNDKKYKVLTKEGKELLLRIADAESYEMKKKEYDIICKYTKLGFEMSKPLVIGYCNEGENTYMLLTWVSGEDLETAMGKLTEKEQYELGRSAGTILRQIHSIPVEEADLPEQTKKTKKLFQLERYQQSDVRIANDETAIQYVKDNIDKIWQEKPVYLHGDFHPGNLILTPKKTLGVIDFNRWEVGDPYEEFYKLESFGVEVSIPYCVGQIDAYFNDEVPIQFWETLAVYVAHASLYSIKWAEKFGQEDVNGMVTRCLAAMKHYDGFRRVIPTWYEEEKKNENSNV